MSELSPNATVDERPPEWPGYGKPCNGCGVCCITIACSLATKYLGVVLPDPCPALERDGNLYRCGLVRNPAKYLGLKDWAKDFAVIELSPKFAYMLRIGGGCDAQL